MKKPTILLILLFLMSISLFSQNIGRDVFSASGGETTNAGIKLSWTIGQGGLAGLLSQSGTILNMGFEQENDNQFLAVIDYYDYEITTTLFPNPVNQDAFLRVTSDVDVDFSYRLFDTKGALVFSKENLSNMQANSTERIPTSVIKPGLYLLQLFFHQNHKKVVSQTFKLLKI